MKQFILFIILSVPVVAISWRALFDTNSHGFYRFFAWEGILWLALNNYPHWFIHPFGIKQIISWILLIYGGYLVIVGILTFKKHGRIDRSRDEKTLLGFEKTTELISDGIYKYIRHPLYASLLFLTWGIYFKHTTAGLLIISVLTSLFLYLTSRFDEKECIVYFGDKYRDYMKKSKMFIPYVF